MVLAFSFALSHALPHSLIKCIHVCRCRWIYSLLVHRLLVLLLSINKSYLSTHSIFIHGPSVASSNEVWKCTHTLTQCWHTSDRYIHPHPHTHTHTYIYTHQTQVGGWIFMLNLSTRNKTSACKVCISDFNNWLLFFLGPFSLYESIINQTANHMLDQG